MITARCPICDRTIDAETARSAVWRPFCSDRCRTIDLGRWLGESYRVPADPTGIVSFDDSEDEASLS